MNDNYEYKIVANETCSPSEKNNNWDIAIGLNKVDGLTPSNYLLELKEYSINGEYSFKQVEEQLTKYYSLKDLNDIKVRDEFQCDIVSTRIAEILEDETFVFSPVFLKSIHSQLFTGVFAYDLSDYVGRFRDYNIVKEEPILQGNTVTYGNAPSLMDYLKYDFDEEKSYDYLTLTKEQQINRLAKFTSAIWQVHPFTEGNTRTTAVFIEKYLRNNGWDINNDIFKEHSLYFRNSLVLANYTNIKNGISPNFAPLKAFFNKMLFDKTIELENLIKLV